jgi:coenzyme F420 hydrogenase subunit beta
MRNATDVAKSRMCIGCGACVYACRDGKLSLMNLAEEGLRPVIDASPCGQCTDCVDVCPGVGIAHNTSNDSHAILNQLTESWGPVLEVWEGHAVDPLVRSLGSSGGLSSALALYCIERGGMQGLLHIAADDHAKHINATTFSTTRAQILGATGSRYAPASPCDGLQSIEDADGPCVFIGKPCDVQAVRKSQVIRPKLSANVGLTIGIFCAGTPSTQGTIDLLAHLGVDPSTVSELRYRGRGWPGTFAVRRHGSATWEDLASYEHAWGFLQKYRPYRCHLCPDGTSEFADIACGDPWYRAIDEDEPGRSLVVVRTARGRSIVADALAAGYVALTPVDPNVLQRSQQELQRKRGAIWARLLTMQSLGVPAPRFHGFSLFRNWLRIPVGHKVRSFVGTARRVVTRGYHQHFKYPSQQPTHPTVEPNQESTH